MAIRERKGRASPFQVYWNNPFTGKRESANFATRHEAEKHDSLIKHRLKFDRESFRNDPEENEKQEQELTLEQAYLLYLREKQFNKKALSWQLGCMKGALKMYGNTCLNEISKQDIEKLMDYFLSLHITPLTVREYMNVLRAVMNWAAEKGFCIKPCFPRLPKAEPQKFIPPTVDELMALLAVAPEHLQRVIIIGAQCGLRVGPSELFSLKWENIDFTQKILRVHGARKNMRAFWREIPIKDELCKLFQKWKIHDEALECEWVINFNGNPIQSIRSSWKKALSASGIKRRIRPYDLRHAFATELIAAGADIGTVAKLMGHSSPNMVLTHYQYVMDKQKREAIECLPEILNVSKSMCPNGKGATTFIVTP